MKSSFLSAERFQLSALLTFGTFHYYPPYCYGTMATVTNAQTLRVRPTLGQGSNETMVMKLAFPPFVSAVIVLHTTGRAPFAWVKYDQNPGGVWQGYGSVTATYTARNPGFDLDITGYLGGAGFDTEYSTSLPPIILPIGGAVLSEVVIAFPGQSSGASLWHAEIWTPRRVPFAWRTPEYKTNNTPVTDITNVSEQLSRLTNGTALTDAKVQEIGNYPFPADVTGGTGPAVYQNNEIKGHFVVPYSWPGSGSGSNINDFRASATPLSAPMVRDTDTSNYSFDMFQGAVLTPMTVGVCKL